MPEATNKRCKSYHQKHCRALKIAGTNCEGCRFFKDKDDPVNNAAMFKWETWYATYSHNRMRNSSI